MDSYFSPKIDKYLAAWILPDTWHKSGHPTDDGRFHMFVKALDYYEYENRLDESMLLEKIVTFVLLSAITKNQPLAITKNPTTWLAVARRNSSPQSPLARA